MFGVFAALLAVFGIGSFYDFQIASAVYAKDTLWASIVSLFGMAPIYWCLLVSGLSMAVLVKRNHLWQKGLLTLLGLAISAYAVYDPMKYAIQSDVSLTAAFAAVVLFVAVPSAGIVWLLRHTPQKQLWQVILFLLVTALCSYKTVSFLKEAVHRPRPVALFDEKSLFFQPWWMITGENIVRSSQAVQEPDLFLSFPSSTTSAAACAFCFVCLPMYVKKLEGSRNWLFAGAAGYTILIAAARMVLGKHFLTDVVSGAMFTLLFFTLFYCITVNQYKKLSVSL